MTERSSAAQSYSHVINILLRVVVEIKAVEINCIKVSLQPEARESGLVRTAGCQ